MLAPLLLLGVAAEAQTLPPDVDALDQLLRAAADRGELVGAVRVVDGDEVLLDAAYGDAPHAPVCRIGSVTKSFTAGAIYALADAGRLSLDDHIGDLLPEVGATVGVGPTLRQLATHRGGLSEPAANPWLPPPSWDEQASVMLPQLTVLAPPGEQYRYSNFGYTLLAVAAARATGESFEEVLQQTIFEPLSLADTGISPDPRRAARLIVGRIPTPLGLVDVQKALPRIIVYDHRWPMGGAGTLTSSPADLVRWAAGLREGTILSEGARSELIRPEGNHDYAAGWKVQDGRVWHNGALEPLGIYAYLRWSPQDRVVVAFCGTPGVGAAAPEWRGPIEDALAGNAVEPPEVTVGGLGWLAALSVMRVHWWLAGAGVLMATWGGTRRRGRLGMGLAGAGLVVLGLGFTHVVLGGVAAALAVAIAVRRCRDLPEDGRQWPVLIGGWLLLCGCGVAGLLGAFSLLVEHIWWIAGQGGGAAGLP